MDEIALQKVLEDAPLYASIQITLKQTVAVNLTQHINGAAAMLEHFARTQRLEILGTNEANGTVKVAKTSLFTATDAVALAEVISKFVKSAEICIVPTPTLTLFSEGSAWFLRLEGGSKLLRTVFTGFGDLGPELSMQIELVEHKNAVAILKLVASQANVLKFAETAADQLQIELIW